MVFFEGQEGDFEEFLLSNAGEEIVLPPWFQLSEGRAKALGFDLVVKDFGRPVVSLYPGGTTVVLSNVDLKQVLTPILKEPDPVSEIPIADDESEAEAEDEGELP